MSDHSGPGEFLCYGDGSGVGQGASAPGNGRRGGIGAVFSQQAAARLSLIKRFRLTFFSAAFIAKARWVSAVTRT